MPTSLRVLGRIAVFVLASGIASTTTAIAQSAADQNRQALKPYLAPRVVTTLDWELVQFNLIWQGSYDGSVEYLTSYPLLFDGKAMRFRATFGVREKRDSRDPEPWFALPKAKRESIMQGAIDHMLGLLSESFPEVKQRPSLLHVEFWFRSAGGGRSVIGRFENGALVLIE